MPEKKAKFDPLIYGEMGSGEGTSISRQIGVNMIMPKSNMFSMFYAGSYRISPNTPSDYKGILFSDFLKQKLNVLMLCYGKVYNGNSSNVRYILRGGIAIGNVITPVNYQHSIFPPGSWINYPNYTYTLNRQFIMGLVLKPSVELTLARYFGLAIGAYANVNPEMSVVGVDASIIFGSVRHNRSYYAQKYKSMDR